MTDMNHKTSTDILTSLHEVNQRMAELMPRLADANKAFAVAAAPLERLSEMDFAHQKEVAAHLRAAQKECDELNQVIGELLAKAASLGNGSSPSPVVDWAL